MRPRNLIAALAALIVLAVVPAVASATVNQDIYASNRAEQIASRSWPGYSFVAGCDQTSRSWWWCNVVGQRGRCFVRGTADVRLLYNRYGYLIRWDVWLHRTTRTCF